MLEYAPPPRWQAGVFDTADRTSATQSQIAKSSAGSVFMAHLDRFSSLERELDETRYLANNWNSYGSPAPAADAVRFARRVLNILKTAEIVPRRVLASAEGGVAIVFTSPGENRAVIESLNDGDLSLLLYNRSGNAEVFDWDWDATAQTHLILALRKHLEHGVRLAAS